MRLKLQHLPEPVAARLRRFHMTRQVRQVVRWGLGTLSLYGVLLLLAIQLDRFMFLETHFRIGLWWGVHGLAALVGVTGFVALLVRRHSSQKVAYDFEAAVQDEAGEHYVTLDHVMQNGGKGASETQQNLIAHLTRETIRHAGQSLKMRPSQDRALRLLVPLLLVLVVVMGGLLAVPNYQFGLMLQRFYHPEMAFPKPGFLQLVLSPENPVVGKGEDIALQVSVKGHMPKGLDWLYRKFGHSASRCIMSMGPDRNDFRFDADTSLELSRVQRDLFLFSKADMMSNFNFIVRCGDAQTGVQHVEVVAQPVVTAVTLEITPPAYSGQPMQTVTNLTQPMQFLSGSKVVVSFKTDQAVPKREVRFEKKPRPQAHTWNEEERSGRFEFVLKKRVVFEIAVKNGFGFANRERVRGIINLRADMPPTVQLDDPPPDVEKVAGELIAFRAGVTDDLGIREVSMRYIVNPNPDEEMPMKELPIPVETNAVTSMNVEMDFDLERVGAVPGDLVQLQLRARDTAGNDGLSRVTRIRVMPFTRDENERLRLRTLLFVQAVLAATVESGIPPFSGGDVRVAPMDENAESAVKTLAGKADIDYAEAGTWGPLFELLEREHHFTDRPRHKDDIRMLRAVLWNTMGRVSPKDSVANGDARVEELRRLTVEIVPGLCRLRQAKNLTWRMFGMLKETERIASDLNRKMDPKSPIARSVARRLQIYLVAIQDLGDELIQLHQGATWIDAGMLRKQIGKINTAAYSVKRGSPARQQAGCLQVADGLNAMLLNLRTAYPTLLAEETQARSLLVAQYRECLARSVKPVGMPTREGYAASAAGLAEDCRMMAANPFASIWTRSVALALLDGIEVASAEPSAAAEAARLKRAVALLEPTEVDLIKRDSRGMQRMAFEWENRNALSEPISDMEKALQLTLSEMEESVDRSAGLAEAHRRFALMAASTNGAEIVMATFGFQDVGAPSNTADVDPSAIQALIQANHLLPEPMAAARQLQKRVHSDTAVLDAILRDRKTISAESGKQLADILGGELRALQQFGDDLELTLRVAGPDQDPGKLEWLMILVREQRNRFEVMTRPSRLALRLLSVAHPDAAGVSAVSAELDKCTVLRKTLVKAVDGWVVVLEQGGALGETEKAKYPILKNYERSRNIYRTLLQMQATNANPVALSQRMRDLYPDLALGYLAEGLRYVEQAAASVQRAEATLRQNSPDVPQAVTRIQACRTALTLLQQHVSRSGDGDAQTRVRRAADNTLQQIEAMKAENTQADAETVSRWIFMIGDINKGVATMTIDLKTALQMATQGFALNGGPAGIWTPPHRLAADRSQRRLTRQMELAVRLENRGLLEAGTPEGAEMLKGAVSWASFVFSVDRSELNPSEGIRLGGSAAGNQTNPLVTYLRDEIQKARQMPDFKHGAEYVRQYLDALYDYLRY